MKHTFDLQFNTVGLTFVSALAFLAVLYPSPRAAAFAGGGGGEGGCCSVPPELTLRARALEQSFSAATHVDLSRQSWAGELCLNHPCEDEVTEDQAKELLRDFFARALRADDLARAEAQRIEDLARAETQRIEDLARADRDRTVTWVGVIIAAFSTLIAGGGLVASLVAMRQSGSNERDIGRLEGRMPAEAKGESIY